jgi:hypothetical protein
MERDEKGSKQLNKIKEFLHRDTMNVEYETYNYTSRTGATGIETKSLKKILEAITGNNNNNESNQTNMNLTIKIAA